MNDNCLFLCETGGKKVILVNVKGWADEQQAADNTPGDLPCVKLGENQRILVKMKGLTPLGDGSPPGCLKMVEKKKEKAILLNFTWISFGDRDVEDGSCGDFPCSKLGEKRQFWLV